MLSLPVYPTGRKAWGFLRALKATCEIHCYYAHLKRDEAQRGETGLVGGEIRKGTHSGLCRLLTATVPHGHSCFSEPTSEGRAARASQARQQPTTPERQREQPLNSRLKVFFHVIYLSSFKSNIILNIADFPDSTQPQ